MHSQRNTKCISIEQVSGPPNPRQGFQLSNANTSIVHWTNKWNFCFWYQSIQRAKRIYAILITPRFIESVFEWVNWRRIDDFRWQTIADIDKSASYVEPALLSDQTRCRHLYSFKPFATLRLSAGHRVYTAVAQVAERQHLRSASRHLLVVPRFQLDTYGHRTFAVAGPTTRNLLRNNLRDPDMQIDCFRRTLKTFLFEQYSAHRAHEMRYLFAMMRYINWHLHLHQKPENCYILQSGNTVSRDAATLKHFVRATTERSLYGRPYAGVVTTWPLGKDSVIAETVRDLKIFRFGRQSKSPHFANPT